jgi:DNA (cytosine-5)-methyltransferase 1
MSNPVKAMRILIPDRFEVLSRESESRLDGIIVPIEGALKEIDSLENAMSSAQRGAFAILRGDSGAGKTTFLHTIGRYRAGVQTTSLEGAVDIPAELQAFTPSVDSKLTVLVLEEREAALTFSDDELETWLHSINAFIRSSKGKRCIVVWPCNTDALERRLVTLSLAIGGKSLLGSRSSAIRFDGPQKDQFGLIAANTISSLNQGAGLVDFGLSESDVSAAVAANATVGDFLSDVRDAAISKQSTITSLVKREQPKVWVVVVAGNEPASDVAGLTRGNLALVDMDRMMSATEANVVKSLKKTPEKLGVLATVLDAKIMHLPVLAATSAVRAFADEPLAAKLKAQDFALSGSDKDDAIARIKSSEVGTIIAFGTQSVLARGKKPGSKSRESFEKVATVASKDDAAVNRAIGRALVEAGLIASFRVEESLEGQTNLRSDLFVSGDFGEARLEMMWRTKTGRADIANYTLKKLEAYGKNIGVLA